VFTGFAMAGYGMTKHHLVQREPGWRRKLVINLSAGVTSTIVVAIFAVAKFTEGAWLVVIVFPLLVGLLTRLNREYRAEAAILEQFRTDRPDMVRYARHLVFVLVNSVDLAVLEALRYGRGLRADELTAIHFVIDSAHAEALRKRWEYYDLETPLRLIDCPDRRLIRAAQELVASAAKQYKDSNVTVLLPRRSYAPLLGRLLHDRTADKISRAISQVPDAAATIVPYDVQSRIRHAYPDLFEQRLTRGAERIRDRIAAGERKLVSSYENPHAPAAVVTIDDLIPGHLGTVQGRVKEVDDVTKNGRSKRMITVGDDSGDLRVGFSHGGADIIPGQVLQITGKARQSGNRPIYMADPSYEVVDEAQSTSAGN
ncbi:MAG: DNA-binding protein, partial [Mycobacteriaceae bacterium]|nr:DNA-binding protein [Mycobacteriaceae bacterium]